MSNDVSQSSARYWDAMVEDFDAIYSGKRASRLAVGLDRWLRRDIYERIDETVRLVDRLGPRQRVLDVGTGTGRLCIPLARNTHSVVGVDFSAAMLARARELAEAAGVAGQCSFIQDDLVEDGSKTLRPGVSFDAVAILGVLDYISDPLPMLWRVNALRPKLIVASFPREGTPRAWLRRARYRVQGLDCPLYFYTARQVECYGRALDARRVSQRVMGQLHFASFWF
jgi:ubiquinone/menaquinone biosynthesis C-methylase UbiE